MDLLLTGLAESVKRFLLPGSLPLLLIGTTVGLGWWYLSERDRGWVRGALTALVLLYWLLATPLVAGLLERGLRRDLQPIAEPVPAEAVLVLGGGASTLRADGKQLDILSEASALRALEAARLYRMLHPSWVIVSGGTGDDPSVPESEPMREALIELGVPQERILLESGSGDTHDQALLLAGMLEEREVEDVVMVTSPTHMRRALLTFENAGLAPTPSISRLDSQDPSRPQPPSWVPTVAALQRSMSASREYLAIVYYWLRGWI